MERERREKRGDEETGRREKIKKDKEGGENKDTSKLK